MKLSLLILLSVAVGMQCMGDKAESLEDNGSCGRRNLKESELSAEGFNPKSGYWPWHVVVTRLGMKVYTDICGGTLISKSWILTAAHCLTLKGTFLQPYAFMVKLGDYYSYLNGISDIIIHEDFNIASLENDIALIKLKSEAVFDDYIQPACIWNDKISEKLSSGDVNGNVVGWAYERKDYPQFILRNATLPMVSEATCTKSNPEFYTKIVDDGKFCVELGKDTATWYGESIGSGFYVFVPHHDGSTTGAWYLRGISSHIPSTNDASSDAQKYAVFTDVAKYSQWIQKHVQ